MVITVKVASEIVGLIQSDRFPRCGAVNINISGEFEIRIVIVGYAAVHHLGKIRQLLGIFNEIRAAFRALPLRPNLGGAVPDGDGLGRNGLKRKNGLYECTKENTDTIALFAHGGSGAIMFSHVLSLPFPFVLTSMPYGVCSVSVVDFTAEPGEMVIPRLELFNDMGHIESFKAEKLHFDK